MKPFDDYEISGCRYDHHHDIVRVDDLLRRCILSQPSTLGLNIRWWSAEPGPSVSQPSADTGPTKVLMGNFLMDDGLGISLPTFFKCEPASNGPASFRNVGLLAHKLGHVKVFHTSLARQRCLTVTQSATNLGIPVSLNEYQLACLLFATFP